MKSRFSALSLLVICLVLAPAAHAQRGAADADSGTIGQIPHPGIGGGVVARAFTNAILTSSSGETIGKVKTATVQTTTKLIQALRLQASDLTPNAEFALVIDSTLVGTATSDAAGNLKMKFADPTDGRVPALPDAIKPILTAHQVQVYEVASQRLVASGLFATQGGGTGR